MTKNNKKKLKKPVKSALTILILVLILGGCVYCGYKYLPLDKIFKDKTEEVSKKENNNNTTNNQTPEVPEEKGPVVTTVSINAVGDCTLGNDTNFGYTNTFDEYYDKYGADFFFENVRDLFESDDITIANLETTFTTATTRRPKVFNFKGPPEYVNVLTGSSVEVVNIANNHMYDYQEQGYQDTMKVLNEAGVKFFGSESMKYQGRTKDYFYIYEKNGIKIGFAGLYCAEDEVKDCKPDIDRVVDGLNEQGVDTIILSMHWGLEAKYTQSKNQEETAHYAIDKGVEMIIGHHPHRIQGLEIYNGKYIVYSLSNFSFGGHKSPSDIDSFIFHVDLTYEDNTLADTKIEVIPVYISSTGTKWNNYKPIILEGDEKQRVLQKIQKYSKNISIV